MEEKSRAQELSVREISLIRELAQIRKEHKRELEYEKFDGYELPPRTQFSMLNKPAVSIKYGVMKFNMACIRKEHKRELECFISPLSLIFRKHPAKLRQDIMRQHPVLPAKRSSTVSCGTMQVHRTGSSFKRRQTAGQQGRCHTG